MDPNEKALEHRHNLGWFARPEKFLDDRPNSIESRNRIKGIGSQSGSQRLRSQDTEEYNFIAYTVVVKLTTDSVDEAPSAMRVVGANSSFFYGPAAGASGCFNARLYHASVMPESEREHLKIAYFFRIIA